MDHDREDRDARRRICCPVLVLWASNGIVPLFGDPVSIWQKWAADVHGEAMTTSGHFLMEESPRETAALIEQFLARRLAR